MTTTVAGSAMMSATASPASQYRRIARVACSRVGQLAEVPRPPVSNATLMPSTNASPLPARVLHDQVSESAACHQVRAKLAVLPRKALGEQRELVMRGRPKERSDRIVGKNLLDPLDRAVGIAWCVVHEDHPSSLGVTTGKPPLTQTT